VRIALDGKRSPDDPTDVGNYDILVFQRQPSHDVLQLLSLAQGDGIQVVFDIDDGALSISKDNPNYLAWGRDKRWIRQQVRQYRREGVPLPGPIRGLSPDQVVEFAATSRRGILNNIRAVDLVTTTTPALRDEYNVLNRNIRILPNQMQLDGWTNLKKVDHPGRLWIGWAGGWTHLEDLKLIVNPIEEIIRRYDTVDFLLVGFTQAKDLIFRNIPEGRVVLAPWTPNIYDYRKWVASMDIVLAPSKDTKFNAGKSDIRVMESWLAAKAPVVASPTTYGETVNRCGGGCVARKAKDWMEMLSLLLTNEKMRRRMGRLGHEYVREERTYDTNIHLWEDAYRSLL